MTQYTDYSTVPSQIREIVANKCSLLDSYILFQTGDGQYVALIKDVVTGEVTQVLFRRGSSYNHYSVTESVGSWEYTITNEYYCYSNIGYGIALDLPVYDAIQSHAAAVFTVVLMFLIVFRSILFPFRKRK